MPKGRYGKSKGKMKKSLRKTKKKGGAKKPKMSRTWHGRPRYQMIFSNLNDENNLSNPLYENEENDFQMLTYDKTIKVARKCYFELNKTKWGF